MSKKKKVEKASVRLSKKKKKRTPYKGKPIGALPKFIKIDGDDWFTPVRLRTLRHKGKFMSNPLKISIYAAYLRNGKRKTLRQVTDELFGLIDKYMTSVGKYRPEKDTLESILFKILDFNSDYLIRNEILDKIQSIRELHPEIRVYKWQCFGCDKLGFFTYGETLALSDIELAYMWEARDIYLSDIDSGSVQFGVWYMYESLTKFAFIDFNEIILDGGDLESYKTILTQVKYDN
jgi:hypothetical protein